MLRTVKTPNFTLLAENQQFLKNRSIPALEIIYIRLGTPKHPQAYPHFHGHRSKVNNNEQPSKFLQKFKTSSVFSEMHSSSLNQDRTFFIVSHDKVIAALLKWVIEFLVHFIRREPTLLQN